MYEPATPSSPASHRNLLRMWMQVMVSLKFYILFGKRKIWVIKLKTLKFHEIPYIIDSSIMTQTERNSGEYDVVQCAAGTPPRDCVYQITAHFKVSDMMKVTRYK